MERCPLTERSLKMVCITALKGEIFKKHTDHNGGFNVFVSNMGNVIDCRNGKIKILSNNGNGYLSFDLGRTSEKKVVREYVHRAVAKNFIDNHNNLPQVNHINGIKNDNRAVNLEWVSCKDNIRHAHNNGAMENRKNSGKLKKLPDNDIMDMYFLVKSLGYTITEVAESYGIPRTTLSSIMNKRSRRSVTDSLDL